jgi:hypothetical protein
MKMIFYLRSKNMLDENHKSTSKYPRTFATMRTYDMQQNMKFMIHSRLLLVVLMSWKQVGTSKDEGGSQVRKYFEF